MGLRYEQKRRPNKDKTNKNKNKNKNDDKEIASAWTRETRKDRMPVPNDANDERKTRYLIRCEDRC